MGRDILSGNRGIEEHLSGIAALWAGTILSGLRSATIGLSTPCHPVYNDAGVVKRHFSLDVLRPTLSPKRGRAAWEDGLIAEHEI